MSEHHATRPPFNPDPGYRAAAPLPADPATGTGPKKAYLTNSGSYREGNRPSKTSAWVLISSGVVLFLIGIIPAATVSGLAAITVAPVFTGIAVIGATAVIVGSALLAVLGAL